MHSPSCHSESFENGKKRDPLSSVPLSVCTRGALALRAVRRWSQNSGNRSGRVRDQVRWENAVDFVSLLDVPNRHEQINGSGGPGVEKSGKKCRLTQHPHLNLTTEFFSLLKQVVLKNIPCNKLRAQEREDLSKDETPPAIQLVRPVLS